MHALNRTEVINIFVISIWPRRFTCCFYYVNVLTYLTTMISLEDFSTTFEIQVFTVEILTGHFILTDVFKSLLGQENLWSKLVTRHGKAPIGSTSDACVQVRLEWKVSYLKNVWIGTRVDKKCITVFWLNTLDTFFELSVRDLSGLKPDSAVNTVRCHLTWLGYKYLS